MNAYLVKDGDELVGFFVAEDCHDLAWIVDHHTDPGICEYAILPSGGITLQGPKLPIRTEYLTWDEIEDDASYPLLSFQHAELHSDWEEAVIYGHGIEWMSWRDLNVKENPNYDRDMRRLKAKAARYAKKCNEAADAD